MDNETIDPHDVMVEGQCDSCGKVDIAGPKAAIATNYFCGWCKRGRVEVLREIEPMSAQVAQIDGWCFDCEKPVTIDCVEGEHAYRLAVTPEEYEAMKD